jgi:hypothetical protein
MHIILNAAYVILSGSEGSAAWDMRSFAAAQDDMCATRDGIASLDR